MTDEIKKPLEVTLEQLTDEMERHMTPDGAVYRQSVPKRVRVGDKVLVKLAQHYWGHEKVISIVHHFHHSVITFESGISERVFPNDRLTVLIKRESESTP